jgi:hypothetical protein
MRGLFDEAETGAVLASVTSRSSGDSVARVNTSLPLETVGDWTLESKTNGSECARTFAPKAITPIAIKMNLVMVVENIFIFCRQGSARPNEHKHASF